jgi:hypothetical protein
MRSQPARTLEINEMRSRATLLAPVQIAATLLAPVQTCSYSAYSCANCSYSASSAASCTLFFGITAHVNSLRGSYGKTCHTQSWLEIEHEKAEELNLLCLHLCKLVSTLLTLLPPVHCYWHYCSCEQFARVLWKDLTYPIVARN